MYNKAKEIKKIHLETGKPIWEIAIEKDIENTGATREEILKTMHLTLDVMKDSAYKGLDKAIISMSKITGGNAVKLNNYKDDAVCGPTIEIGRAHV